MKVLDTIKLLTGSQVQKMSDIGLEPFIILLCVSLICSFIISFLYSFFYGSKNTGSDVHRSFPLLGLAITTIFVSLQFSIPLSLGLLGALSIVRFRTPIKEAEEVGFILLVIAVSLSCATFNFKFAALILIFAVIALILLSKFGKTFNRRKQGGLVVLTMNNDKYGAVCQDILKILSTHIKNGKIDSITHSNDQTSLSYEFILLSQDNYLKLEKEFSDYSFSVYYNR